MESVFRLLRPGGETLSQVVTWGDQAFKFLVDRHTALQTKHVPVILVPVKLAILFLLAVFQSVPPGQTNENQHLNEAQAESTVALPFVKIAGNVADRVRHRSLNNYLGIYVSPKNWQAASKDRDLGPFLVAKEARPKPGRSAACVFSPDRDIALCVYFDGETPFGVATVKVEVSGRIDPYRVRSSYEGVSKKLLKPGEQTLRFARSASTLDDGRVLPAFLITNR